MDFSSKKAQMALIYLIVYVSSIGNPIVLPVLPNIMDEFALSPLEMSLIISVYALPGMLIIPMYGFLSDRLGRRPLLLLGLLLCFLGSMVCYFATSYSWLLFGRALQGLSITPLEALANTLTSDLFDGEERKRMVTRVTVAQYFGIASVPIIISGLLLLGNWRMSFALAAFLGLFSLIFCLPIKLAYKASSAGSLQEYRQHLREMLVSRRLLSLLSVRLTSALLLFGVVYVHFPLLFTERLPHAAHLVGPIYSIYAVGMFLGSLVTTHVNIRYGASKPGIIGGSMLTLGLALLLFMTNPWIGGIAMVAIGTGTALVNASCVGHVSLATTPDTKGSIMSAYSTTFRAGQTVFPIICGLFYQMAGSSGLFATATLVSACFTIWATITFRYADKVEHQNEC